MSFELFLSSHFPNFIQMYIINYFIEKISSNLIKIYSNLFIKLISISTNYLTLIDAKSIFNIGSINMIWNGSWKTDEYTELIFLNSSL